MRLAYDKSSIQVYHGDASHNVSTVREAGLIGAVDLIVTSPPYDDIRDYGGTRFDFHAMREVCAAMLAPGGVLVWVVGDSVDKEGSETMTSFKMALDFRQINGLLLHDTMIYVKSYNGNHTPNRYSQAFEYMFVFSNGKPKTFNPLKDVPVVLPRRQEEEGWARQDKGRGFGIRARSTK